MRHAVIIFVCVADVAESVAVQIDAVVCRRIAARRAIVTLVIVRIRTEEGTRVITVGDCNEAAYVCGRTVAQSIAVFVEASVFSVAEIVAVYVVTVLLAAVARGSIGVYVAWLAAGD
jgi:hypothetical protein